MAGELGLDRGRAIPASEARADPRDRRRARRESVRLHGRSEPGRPRPSRSSVVAVSAGSRRRLVGLAFGDERLGGEHQADNAGRVLQGGAHDLHRVDDALVEQVAVFTGGGVVTEVALALAHLVEDDRAFFARVLHDLAEGLLDRAADDRDAELLLVAHLELVEGLLRADERDAAAGDDAFFDRRAGRVERVFDAGLLLLHLGLGGCADLDDRDAADELGEALLELLAVVVGGGVLDLGADLGDAALDLILLALAADDGGVVLVDRDAFGAAEIGDRDVLELEAELFGR